MFTAGLERKKHMKHRSSLINVGLLFAVFLGLACKCSDPLIMVCPHHLKAAVTVTVAFLLPIRRIELPLALRYNW